MSTLRRGFTLVETLVALSFLLILAVLLLPALRVASEEDARKACRANLSQIVKACITYQEPNGEFFPAHSQYITGTTDDYKPMPSLAVLFPTYLDDVDVFSCPATTDKPFISRRYNQGARWNCFGTDVLGEPATNPVAYSGMELSTELKCSYFYDERSHFRDVGPSQAMACDADGQTWTLPDGTKPPYPANWTRAPRESNHKGGQNVMYFDGHVTWVQTPYGSDDPNDNMFCPDVGPTWNPDVDCYLWDGVNARPPQQHDE